jgi:hypothetical protein
MKYAVKLGSIVIVWCLFLSSSLEANEPIVLTVEDHSFQSPVAHQYHFTLSQLTSLPVQQIKTENPWYSGEHVYTGFDIQTLLDQVGVSATQIKITALNNYATEIPIEDFLDYGAIFATHIDGKQLTIRNRGPLMVIYPFTDFPQIKNETYYGRSIWQIRVIELHN